MKKIPIKKEADTHKRPIQPTRYKRHHKQGKVEGEESKWDSTLWMNELMKSYHRKKAFGGGWDEYLDQCIRVYETLYNMCEVSDTENIRTLPIMLSGDAFPFFSSQIKKCTTCEEAV